MLGVGRGLLRRLRRGVRRGGLGQGRGRRGLGLLLLVGRLGLLLRVGGLALGVLLGRGLLLGVRAGRLLMGRLRLLLRVRRLRGGQLRGLRLRLLLLLIRRLRVRGLGWRLLRVGRLLLLRMRALLVVVGSLALLPIRAGALLPVRRHLLCVGDAAHRTLRPALHSHGVSLGGLWPIGLAGVAVSLLWPRLRSLLLRVGVVLVVGEAVLGPGAVRVLRRGRPRGGSRRPRVVLLQAPALQRCHARALLSAMLVEGSGGAPAVGLPEAVGWRGQGGQIGRAHV